LERIIVGLLRISARLLRREELANDVLSSLRMLLIIKNNIIRKISRQIAYGLHDLLRTNAANIHSCDDWLTLFSILQVIGAGAGAPPIITSPFQQQNDNKLINSC
jgi:brefeldin A-resistance guanine nucleotide exchange factor 1